MRSSLVARGLPLEIVGWRTRNAGRLAVRAVVHARRDVAHGVFDNPRALGSGTQTDRCNRMDLINDCLPDLLAQLDPLLLRHGEPPQELAHDVLDPGWRLLALRASRLEPLCIQHTGRVELCVVREYVAGESEQVLRAV